MDSGYLIGFGGAPISRNRQALLMTGQFIDREVGGESGGIARGYGFELRNYEAREINQDPYVLYDRFGSIVYQWPENYIPHWTEVLSVCRTLTIE